MAWFDRLPTAGIPLIRFLDTNGDGTGTKDANGNYAAAAEEFYIAPPADTLYVITEFLIHLADASNFAIGGFGSRAVLTNGLKIEVKRAGVVIFDINDGIVPKTNAQMLHLSHRALMLDFPGTNGNSLIISFNSEDFHVPLILNGALSDSLVVTLNDDFSTQDDFHFIVHGYQ
jgi:hypothetical protein